MYIYIYIKHMVILAMTSLRRVVRSNEEPALQQATCWCSSGMVWHSLVTKCVLPRHKGVVMSGTT